jgi:hypothetical protein
LRELIEKEHRALANRAAAWACRQFLDDHPGDLSHDRLAELDACLEAYLR